MGKVPSPCIDVCKYKRQGYCIGCGMSKDQKKTFKRLDGRRKKLAFLRDLLVQQRDLGGFPMWPRAYRKICRKKDVACPLDLIETPEGEVAEANTGKTAA